MFLNVIFAIAYSTIDFIQIIEMAKIGIAKKQWLIYVPYVGGGILQFIAFILLQYGVFKIRRLILTNNNGDLNQKMIMLHLSLTALWLIAAVTLCISTILPN
jgi:hypothetical protein